MNDVQSPAGSARGSSQPKVVLVCFLLALPVLLTIGLPSSASPQSPIQVQWKQSKLSVVAENAPLSQILAEVGRVTGIQMRNLQGLDGVVSAHFSDLALKDGLRNLLSGVDYAVMGDPSSAKTIPATRVVILKNLDSSPQDIAAKPVAAARPPTRPPAEPSDAKAAAEKEALVRDIVGPDPQKQAQAFETLMNLDPQAAVQALQEAIRNGQGNTRLQALQLLDQDSQADQETILSELGAALHDSDASMKDYAVQAIARQSGTDAMDLLGQAFRDPDPQVRLMVIQSLADKGDGQSLLREAIADPDAGVSAAAAALLQSLNAAQNTNQQQ